MILNLTQHPATAEQADAGVVEPRDKEAVRRLLTFNSLPSGEEIAAAASALAELASADVDEVADGDPLVMIGGAPFLMAPLERALRRFDLIPLYAFSRRESVEEVADDGTVTKRSVFRHAGFVAGERPMESGQ